MKRDRLILARHIEKLHSLPVDAASDEPSCSHVALSLHHIYTAIENVLKQIGSAFEGPPGGDRWHLDLLAQLARETEVRPQVLSPEVFRALTELLAFRHYLIHGSVIVQPDGERLSVVRQVALDVAPLLGADLDRFDQYLEKLLAAQ